MEYNKTTLIPQDVRTYILPDQKKNKILMHQCTCMQVYTVFFAHGVCCSDQYFRVVLFKAALSQLNQLAKNVT